jgi:tetratricopeptide (TPR) repeat protein
MSTQTAGAPSPAEPPLLDAWAAALAEAEREVAEIEAAERAAGAATPAAAAAPEAAPVRSRRRPLAVAAGLVAACLVGVGVCVAAGGGRRVIPAAPEAEPEPPPRYANLAAADVFIRSGLFAEARAELAAAPPAPGKAHAVAYRDALCLEALGSSAAAADAYRRAEGPPDDVVSWARAVLGRVRCAAAADPAEARRLLDEVTRKAGHAGYWRWGIVGECAYLRARLEVLALGPPDEPTALAPHTPAWLPFDGHWAEYLDCLPATPPEELPPARGIDPTASPAGPGPNTAAAALKQACALAWRHPGVPAAQLALANLDRAAGRWQNAGSAYRQLLHDLRHEPAAAAAAYNLGLVELRDGKPAAARKCFTEVIDRDPGGRWAALGWWWVGRTHLDEGAPAAARSAFGASRGHPAVAPAAAVAIAASHFAEGNADAAWAALRGCPPGATGPAAAWADLFAHWPGRLDPTQADAARTALGRVGDGHTLGRVGTELVSRASRDLGVPAPAAPR